MNLLNKTLLASSMLAVSMSVSASKFYVDTAGTGIGSGLGDPTNCATCTNDKDELTYQYVSATDITTSVANTISVGDSLVTKGGLDFTSQATLNSSFDANNFSAFNPTNVSRGYNSDRTNGNPLSWSLSFVFNLVGTVQAVSATDLDLNYTGGIFEVYLATYSAAGDVSATNIFDINITGSDASNGSNFLVFGEVGFSGNEPAIYQNMFHDNVLSCGGSSSYFALVNCTPKLKVGARFDQNLDYPLIDLTSTPGHALIGGTHNGSLSFNVPEPTTLMLLGSALLGLSATRRKKA